MPLTIPVIRQAHEGTLGGTVSEGYKKRMSRCYLNLVSSFAVDAGLSRQTTQKSK